MKNLDQEYCENILKGLETLCDIFWGPSPDQCGILIRGELLTVFEPLEREFGADIGKGLVKIKEIIKRYNNRESLFDRLNDEYVRLFISHRDGIVAPLYESCYEYENAPLMGPPAARMKNLFESEGLTLSDRLNEPPDHLCIELEYLYFMMKEAIGGKRINKLKESINFVSNILLPWIEKFYDKLALEVPDYFYTASALILRGLLRSIRNVSLLNG